VCACLRGEPRARDGFGVACAAAIVT
jgi:hypothetical protein